MQLANYAAGLVEISYEPKGQKRVYLQNFKITFILYDKDPSKKILPTLKDVFEKDMSRIVSFPHVSLKAKEFGTNTVHTIKGHMEQGFQYHYTMETQTCVVVPIEDGLDVYSSSQWIDYSQIAIADALNIPNSSINMQVRRIGGAYGGKATRSGQIACAAAVAAYLLNRPVRFVMSLEQNMTVVGKRYSCFNDYELEIDSEGIIQKMNNDFVQDYGCTPNEPVFFHTGEFFKNCYDFKYWNSNVKAVITEAPSNTYCRAPGTTEGVAMIENIMEHIAKKVNKDPVDVRLANIPDDSELKKILPEFVKSVGKFYESINN